MIGHCAIRLALLSQSVKAISIRKRRPLAPALFVVANNQSINQAVANNQSINQAIALSRDCGSNGRLLALVDQSDYDDHRGC